MPELTVSPPLWIASQVFGFVCVALAMWAFQIKRKAKTIFIIGFANLFSAISLALLQNWVVFALICVAVLRSFVFYVIELRIEKKKEINQRKTFLLMLFFMIASVIPVVFTWNWWFDWVILGCSLFIIFGNWAKGVHLIRISCFLYDSLIIINHINYFNIIGLVQSALLTGSVVFFYIRFFTKKTKSQTPTKTTKHLLNKQSFNSAQSERSFQKGFERNQ